MNICIFMHICTYIYIHIHNLDRPPALVSLCKVRRKGAVACRVIVAIDLYMKGSFVSIAGLFCRGCRALLYGISKGAVACRVIVARDFGM